MHAYQPIEGILKNRDIINQEKWQSKPKTKTENAGYLSKNKINETSTLSTKIQR